MTNHAISRNNITWMNKEIHVSSRALVVRTNGVFYPTNRGHIAHELDLMHRLLKNHTDPNIAFAMSPEQVQKYCVRKEELCDLLGLPQDEQAREKRIQGFSGHLARAGIPYYRVGPK